MQTTFQNTKLFSFPVLVCALGYFVDAYDLLIFSAVRVASLKDMGVPEAELMATGIDIINMQMLGLVLGGILFGLFGDWFGRMRMLFLSIITYSVATFASAYAQDVTTYTALRFLAGIGIAGELGLAVTLLSEILKTGHRAYAVGIVAGFGMVGAVLAGYLASHVHWQQCYIIGGAMGALLLILRIRVFESGLYQSLDKNTPRGSVTLLLSSKDRLRRLATSILIATPIPFIFWMLVAFAPEFSVAMGLSKPMAASNAIFFAYLGFTLGDFIAPCFSEIIKSRRKALFIFQVISLAICSWYLIFPHPDSPYLFNTIYFLLGLSAGYWALMALVAAEQFGTNLRATVATMVPNLARALSVPMSISLLYLKPEFGLIYSAIITCAAVFAIAMIATYFLKETYGRNIDFLET